MSSVIAVGGAVIHPCFEPICGTVCDGLDCQRHEHPHFIPSLLKLTKEQIESIERHYFPEWFDVCHQPIQSKPDWLAALWKNCVNY